MKLFKESKKFIIFLIALIIVVSSFIYYYFVTLNSIELESKSNYIEYGSNKYNIKNLVKTVNCEIVSVKNINTKKLGIQKVVFKVRKKNFFKEIVKEISIKDTKAPIIKIKEENITVYKGENINLLDNILSVKDEVDGEIFFSDNTSLENRNYYSLFYSEDINSIGEHEIVIKAYDKSGNMALKSFNINVLNQKVKKVFLNYENIKDENTLVNIALSLVGYPYVNGSNGPNGFDCSGFVQYVYSKVGINISRSTSTQIFEGFKTNYESAKAGDILCWGNDSYVAHSALYIGNGKMVHATNPNEGVIISNVDDWIKGSGQKILSVRRIL